MNRITPTKNSPRQQSGGKDMEEEEYCILCKYKSITPVPGASNAEQKDDDYIACDTCDQWVHMRCVNLRPEECGGIRLFQCPPCASNATDSYYDECKNAGFCVDWKPKCARCGCPNFADNCSKYCGEACGVLQAKSNLRSFLLNSSSGAASEVASIANIIEFEPENASQLVARQHQWELEREKLVLERYQLEKGQYHGLLPEIARISRLIIAANLFCKAAESTEGLVVGKAGLCGYPIAAEQTFQKLLELLSETDNLSSHFCAATRNKCPKHGMYKVKLLSDLDLFPQSVQQELSSIQPDTDWTLVKSAYAIPFWAIIGINREIVKCENRIDEALAECDLKLLQVQTQLENLQSGFQLILPPISAQSKPITINVRQFQNNTSGCLDYDVDALL